MNKTSVCMATYNGEDYLQEQIDSILPQMSDLDELLIVDDASTDSTIDIIHRNMIADKRIRLIENQVNVGHVKSFEEAISLSTGEYIVLSDQDDIWAPKRLGRMIGRLKAGASFVVTEFDSFSVLGQCRRRSRLPKSARPLNVLRVFFGRVSYFGCAMAFSRDLKRLLLPFPLGTEMHDIWLALVSNCSGLKVEHLHFVSVSHRLHSSNKTPRSRRSIGKLVLTRVILIKSIVIIAYRRASRLSSVVS